jgi:hypothetical protein
VYGGYFTLDSASTATGGAALYASNSTTTANILQLQDNTTDVFTVADGGNVTAAGDIAIQGGDLTTNQTTFNLLAGATTAINIGPASNTAVSINLAGGGSDTGCTVAGATGNLTCSGAIQTNATSGIQGWWTRTGSSLSPTNSGDAITTTGNISTTSSGTLSIAGTSTLTGNVGIGTTPGSFEGLVVAKTYGSATAAESYSQRITTTYSIADTGTKQGLRLNTNATNTTGTQASLVGLLALNSSNGNGGTTTDSTALWARNDAATGSTIQSAYGLKIVDGTGAGTINNQYGVYVNSLTKGGTNNYAIYTAGSTPSLFGGIINANATGKTAIQIADSGAQNSGITIGGDTNLYRATADWLWTDDHFGATNYIQTNNYYLAQGSNTDKVYLNTTGTTSRKGEIIFQDDGTNTWALGQDIAGSGVQEFHVYDSIAGATRLSINSNGQVQLPVTGSNGGILIGGDAQIYRTASDMLGLGNGDSLRAYSSGGSQFLTLQSAATSVYLDARNSGASDWVLVSKVTSDSQQRYILKTNGEMQWGDGASAPDTILTRSGAGSINLQPTSGNNSQTAFTIKNGSNNTLLAFDNSLASGRLVIGGTGTSSEKLELYRNDTTTANHLYLTTHTGTDWSFGQDTSSNDLSFWNDTSNANVLTLTEAGNLLAKGSATATTKTTEANNRTNVTTVTLTSAGFANNDVIRLVRSGTYYYTRIVSGGGTTTLTVSPAVSYDASSTVTKYNVQYLGNDGATFTGTTRSDNSYFQGYFTGGIVTGTGSTTYSDGNIASTNDIKIQAATGLTVQNSSNSTTAFQIQNTANANVLNVDTTTSIISISAPLLTYKGGADVSGSTNSGTGNSAFNEVAVSGRYQYIAASGNATACSQTAGSAIGCELQVYDISNPGTPTYVGGADASGSTNSGTGNSAFNEVAVSGRYAYVASQGNATACSQTAGSAIGCELKVFDISNPSAPTYVGGADVSGSTNSGTGNSALRSVAISGRYAYTGLSTGSATACSQTAGSAIGCELKAFDISNPAAPTYLGGADASGSTNSGTGNGPIDGLDVSGRYIYGAGGYNATACSQTAGSAIGCELKAFDISNPGTPTYIGGADASGSTNSGTGGGSGGTVISIATSGRYAYTVSQGNATACSQTAGSAIGCEFKIYDVSNPATPTYVGGADASGSTNSGTDNNLFLHIAISGRYAYMVSNASATACSQTAGSAIGCELKEFDVSNPATPTYVGGADASGSTNSGTGSIVFNAVAISGRYAYTASGSSATACSQTAGSAIGCELKAFDLSGIDTPSIYADSAETGSLQVAKDAQVAGDINVQGNLNVGQNAEINGDLGVGGSAIFQDKVDSTSAVQIQNAGNTVLFNADTVNSQIGVTGSLNVTGGVSGGNGGASGGFGSSSQGDSGGGGGGGIGGANAVDLGLGSGDNGAQSLDVSGLFSVLSGLGVSTTSPGAGGANTGIYCTPGTGSGGNSTGFGSGGGGAGFYGANGGNGLYGGGGGGASGGTGCPSYSGGSGGQGVVVVNPTGGTNQLLSAGSSYTVGSGVTTIKIWAVGGGGGGAGSPTGDSFSGGGGGAGGVAYRTFSVHPGQVITYSLGSAGSGGTGASNGTAGGNTTVTVNSTTITANGGAAGQYNNLVNGAGGSLSLGSGDTPFQVQDTSGNNLLNIDTTNSRITIGASDTTATLLVLDTKTSSGDPTCVSGGMYYNSSSNQAKVCINGSWAAVGVPTVTSLPGSPADGDEVYYQFNRGDGTNAYWHLRYNSSTTYWDYLGGPGIYPSQVATEQTTASTSYTTSGFTSLSTTLPLQGDYDISIGMRYWNSSAAAYGYMSLSYNGSAPVDSDGIANSGSSGIGDVSEHTFRKTGLGANSVTAQYKVAGGTGFFSNRWMYIAPIRVK